MRKITFLILIMVGVSVSSTRLFASTPYAHSSEAVIFVEGGVEFAVYPDGQFDFFYNPKRNGYNINVVSPNVNISFNSGYNYDPYIQLDDFGAVIQIERVPIFYDYYGRIIQAGKVSFSYNNYGLLHRVGRMYLHYNPYRQFTHTSGFINSYNRRYVPRPWHRYYMRPYSHVAVVFSHPYRSHYYPKRIGYDRYRKHFKKQKAYPRNFHRPGDKVNTFYRGTRTAEARNIPQNEAGEIRSNQNSTRSSSTVTAVRGNTSSQRDAVRGKSHDARKVAKSSSIDPRNTTYRSPNRTRSQSKAASSAVKENSSRVGNKNTKRTSISSPSSNRQESVNRSRSTQENLNRARSTSEKSAVRSTKPSRAKSTTTSRSSRGRN